jgi:transposase InsO family protein
LGDREIVVPSLPILQLYVLVIVRLGRRELAWINLTAHPTAEWIAQQLREAFPWNEAPGYLTLDRDGIYGAAVTRRLRAMGIRDKPIAPGSPWQNAYVERLIGTIRRECLDHMIVFGEAHLRRLLGQPTRKSVAWKGLTHHVGPLPTVFAGAESRPSSSKGGAPIF